MKSSTVSRIFWFTLWSVALLAMANPVKARVYNGDLDLSDAWGNYSVGSANATPAVRFPYMHCFEKAAKRHDVPLTLLLAVARGESDFNPSARSKANAHGLMQILWPGTAQHLGIHRLSQLYDPCTNADAGARYLKEMIQRYNGDLHLALAAYNYGPQRIQVDADEIPRGAEWYSGYIFRHLDYVLGSGVTRAPGEAMVLYSEEGKLELLTFGEPYRAEAFVQSLEEAQPDLRLDWFRNGVGEFRVVLLYDSRESFNKSLSRLSAAGFPVQ